MEYEGTLIHLVHHDSDVLLDLYAVLSAAGFQVAASSNTATAVSYIIRAKPRAVLCHWEMPEMDGAELIRSVRSSSPSTRFVMSSRHADAFMYDEVLGKGGDDLLREPFHDLAVVHVVSRLLGFSVPYPAYDLAPLPCDASLSHEGGGAKQS